MGKRSIEERIKEEAEYVIELLRKTNGSPIDPKHHLHYSVCNVMCSVMFGKRFDYQDEEYQNLIHCLLDSFRIMSNPWGLMYNIYPGFMKYIPGPHKQLMKNYTFITDLIRKRVENNIKSLDSDNPRDYIDCFLIKMEKEQKKSATYYHHNTLVMSIMMLLIGSTETVSNTLGYLFLLLMKHPNVAEKVNKEIDDVIGHRPPNYEDRHKMPYTEAFIHEVQRFADVVPMSLPHELTKDTQIRNYTFRKASDRQVLERRQVNALTGKRSCPGMSLALMEIFLFVTTMLQNFTIKSLVSPEDISIDPVGVGLAHIPPNYEFCLLPRSQE
ncbi:cytochrome P450 2F2-like [Mixophyes fleayi]|uniref:cytochrome P450 2F2-like n=1 Tax=Mixophyes fleayi TaxID=3061075 RepID=UPI003F4D8369